MTGCHRDGADADPAQAAARARREALGKLQRPNGLFTLLSDKRGAGAEWLQRLLDPGRDAPAGLRLSASTRYDVTPSTQDEPEATPARLGEETEIQADAAGLRILHNNDHGYGFEAISLKDGWLYLKMRHGPFVRRRPEDDEVGRLLAAAEGSDALLELLSPFLDLKRTGDAAEAPGAPVALTLGLRSEPAPLPPSPGGGRQRASLSGARGRSDLEASRRWRGAATVQSLSGTAAVDPERRALLSLHLSAAFTAPRALSGDGLKTAPVQVRVEHRMDLSMTATPASGKAPVAAPVEWIEPPTRPRPMLDRQELLDGLVKDTRRP